MRYQNTNTYNNVKHIHNCGCWNICRHMLHGKKYFPFMLVPLGIGGYIYILAEYVSHPQGRKIFILITMHKDLLQCWIITNFWWPRKYMSVASRVTRQTWHCIQIECQSKNWCGYKSFGSISKSKCLQLSTSYKIIVKYTSFNLNTKI